MTLSGGTFDTVMRRKSGSTIAPTDLLADGYTFVNRGTSVEVSTSQAADLTNVKVVSKETVNALVSLTVDGTKTRRTKDAGRDADPAEQRDHDTNRHQQRHVYAGLERPYADERI